MNVFETPFKDAFLIKLDKSFDARGSFTSLFCLPTLKLNQIKALPVVQSGISYNSLQGTLRGMHYQLPSKAQQKWVHCLKGKIFDVILDLRVTSKTFGKSYGVNLSDSEPTIFFIPEGFAHGFITLEEKSEVLYHLSEGQSISHERIIRWNDPCFNIQWPFEPSILSEKDKLQADFNPKYHLSVFNESP